MVSVLISFVIAYAAAILLVHLSYRKWDFFTRTRAHIVLIVYNEESRIEWMLRSLFFWSWLKGRPFKLTIIDEGSTDETLTYIRKLTQEQEVEIYMVDHTCTNKELIQYLRNQTIDGKFMIIGSKDIDPMKWQI